MPVEFIITSAEKAMADYIWDEWMNARFGLLVAEYWAQNNYTDESRWNFRVGTINSYSGSTIPAPCATWTRSSN